MTRYSIYKNKILADIRSDNINFNIDGRVYYVYRVTEIKTNNHYYGSRIKVKEQIDDDFWFYCTSSKRKKIIKENKQDYKVKIIKIFNNHGDMILWESFLHQYFNVKKHNNFFNESNQTPFGFSTCGISPSKEQRLALSKKIKGVKKPKGFGEKISKALKGRTKSKEEVDKIQKSLFTVGEDGKTPHAKGVEKAKKTVQQIEENGETIATNRSRKSIKTMGTEGLKKRARKTVENRDNKLLSEKAMKTKIENGLDFNKNAQKAADTRGKEGYQKSTEKGKMTKIKKGKWYRLMSIFQESEICILPAIEIRKLSGSLPNKTKEDFLGKTSTAQGLLKRNNKMEMYGLYVEEVKDVIKEESDIMAERGLEPKPLNSMISKVARNWFQEQLNSGLGL